MSNYRGHVKHNCLFWFPTAFLVLHFWMHPTYSQLGAFSGAFFYATFFMNPDLDLVHQVKLFSVRGLCSLPFRWYSRVFMHRGISHHIILGTVSRLVWAFGVYLIVFYFLYRSLDGYDSFFYYVSLHKHLVYYGVFGVFFADLGHLLVDGIGIKRLFRL